MMPFVSTDFSDMYRDSFPFGSEIGFISLCNDFKFLSVLNSRFRSGIRLTVHAGLALD